MHRHDDHLFAMPDRNPLQIGPFGQRFIRVDGRSDVRRLFGERSMADAMYAPVVTRLRTYGVTVDSDSDAYCKAVLGHPAMKEWIDAAKNEPWLIAAYELA